MAANYDFQTLSPRDFEQLSKDLLQKKLNVSFQIFKEGKDQGIDLLLQKVKKKNDIVVQCKRYEPKAFSRLKRDIEKKELPKVKKLSPKRYILITSVGLSLSNKDELLTILSPYCQGTQDIYGADEVNGLLDEFPEVQESNFKLWLTSTPVLQRVLHANIANFSDHGTEYIKNHYSRFVPNNSVPKAREILKDHHYCIIAGKPGIGKTTLAHVLLSQYIADGYEMVSISHDIEEAWKKHTHGKKKVFYYDDFLGQTKLGADLQKNEDDRLLKFIDLISSTKESFFILTTREYILNQAALTYEKIGKKAKKLKKCIIELEDYNKVNKAEILCNHIFFSSLETEKKLKLLDPELYLKILNHKNYYPRLIEDITDRDFLDDYPDSEYSQAVINYFDDPSAIWERAFRSLSNASQTLLLVLTTFSNISYYEELEEAFNSVYSFFAKKKQWKQGLNDYRDALAELDGSPVKVTKIQFTNFGNSKAMPKEGFSIEFENPSIRDFLENYLLRNARIVEDLFHSSIFFEQIYYLMSLEVGKERKTILEFLYPLKEQVFEKTYELIKSGSSCSKIRPFTYSSNRVGHYVEKDWSSAEKMGRIMALFSTNGFVSGNDIRDRCYDFVGGLNNYENTLNGLVRLADEIKALNKKVENPIDISNTKIRSLILEKASDVDDYYNASSYLLDLSEDNEEIEQRLYDAINEEAENALSDDGISAEHLSDLKDKISHLSSLCCLSVSDIDERIDKKNKRHTRNGR
jgi:hypothetical protein